MQTFLKKYRDWFLLFGLLGIMAAGFSIYFLPGMWWRAGLIAKAPHEMTLENLAQNGPGDNPHVVITEFACASSYAFEIKSKSHNNPTERYGQGRAWIPLFPKTQIQYIAPGEVDPLTEPTSFVVLLQTSPTLGNATTFKLLSRRPSMPGLAVPYRRSGVSGQTHEQLRTAYPDTDFDQCIVLEEFDKGDRQDTVLFAYLLAIGLVGGLIVGIPTLTIAILVGIYLPREPRPKPTDGPQFCRSDGPVKI